MNYNINFEATDKSCWLFTITTAWSRSCKYNICLWLLLTGVWSCIILNWLSLWWLPVSEDIMSWFALQVNCISSPHSIQIFFGIYLVAPYLSKCIISWYLSVIFSTVSCQYQVIAVFSSLYACYTVMVNSTLKPKLDSKYQLQSHVHWRRPQHCSGRNVEIWWLKLFNWSNCLSPAQELF